MVRRSAMALVGLGWAVALPVLTGEAMGDDFSIGNTSTATQGDLLWNQTVLYPAGVSSDAVRVQASVTLPPGWQFATAMPEPSRDGDRVSFAVTNLTTLVDSPLMMGSLFREFDVSPAREPRQHYLDVFGETAADLAVPAERVEAVRRLVAQTQALFGARHYGSYRFLVEAQGGDHEDGLEHHESSDNHLPELGLVDPGNDTVAGTLLAHEMMHCWNGKYRRPAGLALPRRRNCCIRPRMPGAPCGVQTTITRKDPRSGWRPTVSCAAAAAVPAALAASAA